MFENIGKKIKGVAQFVTWLEIVASVIVFVILVMDKDTLGLAFAVLIVGCIGAWLSSLVLYGFGQLIDNSDLIASKINSEGAKSIDELISESDIQEKAVIVDPRSLEELVDALNLTAKQKSDLEELREWVADGLITTKDCKDRISRLLSDKPSELVNALLNKI